jgi:hypothetical protein
MGKRAHKYFTVFSLSIGSSFFSISEILKALLIEKKDVFIQNK